MSEIRLPIEREGAAFEPMGTRGRRLGLVSREPLDTMLRLECSPPPMFAPAAQTRPGGAMPHGMAANRDRLAAAHLQLKLADAVLALEEIVAGCGDDAVIAGLDEVHRFLVHTRHAKLLRETTL